MSTLVKTTPSPRRRASSGERKNPYAPIEVYYNDAAIRSSLGNRLRAVGTFAKEGPTTHFELDKAYYPRRRTSHDEYTQADQELLVNVDRTITDLLLREDQDQNSQITIEDNGPKHISIGTLASAGFHTVDLRGNYVISNLLQELTLAQDLGLKYAKIHKARLHENPVDRLTRRIRDEFWKNLERRLDASLIEKAGKDPKDWTGDPRPRIYVPHGCPEQLEYYQRVATANPDLRLDVCSLPPGPYSAEFVQSLNGAPGILALAMRSEVINGVETFRGEPFTVPGGRFNEFYGWDSYMIAVGLIAQGKVEMAKSMAINFAFCIEHYGKILNANRSYYLMRSQPPFLTEMALRIFEEIKHQPGALDFLQHMTQAAIKEYYSVWMSPPRHDPASGLSRYRPDGKGVPPETEASHFVHVIEPYAKKQNLTFDEYVKAYNSGEVMEPDLDKYLLHDRAVRESGHDTSYRLEGVAADLATVDLNSLLYKYETDISNIIRTYFKDRIPIPTNFQTEANRIDGYETSSTWDRRAKMRKIRMEKYMWDPEAGMFFDYNTATKQRTDYESVTTFWTMWAGLATPKQAASLILQALPKFEEFGGLVSGTKKSRGEIHLARPNRQWDYPFGWAPQQILAWEGLQRYGYQEDAQRLAYKWLYMVIKAFVDFNGVVVEKYDVTREVDPHKVEAEYGNQGADFKGVPREGFGWVNASFVYGLSYLPMHMKRALGTITPWDTFHTKTKIDLDELSELTIAEESENLGGSRSNSVTST